MMCRVVWYKFIDVSEVLAASIIRAMMMEAARTSEKLVNFYQTTRRYNPEFVLIAVRTLNPTYSSIYSFPNLS
jgi:hypothetical protein